MHHLVVVKFNFVKRLQPCATFERSFSVNFLTRLLWKFNVSFKTLCAKLMTKILDHICKGLVPTVELFETVGSESRVAAALVTL